VLRTALWRFSRVVVGLRDSRDAFDGIARRCL